MHVSYFTFKVISIIIMLHISANQLFHFIYQIYIVFNYGMRYVYVYAKLHITVPCYVLYI